MTSTSARAVVVGALVVAALVTATLSGCAVLTPAPVPSTQGGLPTPGSGPTSNATAAPSTPGLVSGGTAEQNQPYFDSVNLAYFAASGTGSSLGIVDSLIAAGFRKQDLEVTADTTSIDLKADSTIVSVRLKGQCLIGDFKATGYKSIITPLLGTGGCLIGTTVPIP